jgi:outer membrane beta-barrel protein
VRTLLLTVALVSSPVLARAADPEPVDSSTDHSPTAVAAAPSEAAPATNEPAFVEERARSVAARAFKKKGRLSLSAAGSVSINDAFFTKLGGMVAATWYPKERLGIGLRGGGYGTFADDDTHVVRTNLQSVPVAVHPVWSVAVELEWSPFYGKVRFNDHILYLDGYLIGGLGSVGVPRPTFAVELGGGLRVSVSDTFALTASVLDTTYTAAAATSQLGLLQSLTTFNLGFSIFLGGA